MAKKSILSIALIGRVDETGVLVDGQTVKTRTLYRELVSDSRVNVYLVDTKDYRRRFMSVLWHLFVALLHCRNIILCVSSNGRRFFFPTMSFASRCLGKKVYHDAIANGQAREVSKNPKYLKYMRSFQINWVESQQIVSQLEALGLNNVAYLPNIKHYVSVSERDLQLKKPYRFCTFSRVMKEKGITQAIQSIRQLNENTESDKAFLLDIYGPIADDYRAELQALIEDNPTVHYRGVADPEQAPTILSRYHALLFPTQWLPEGMPGTILDSLTAGTPIIASRWSCYDEMLEDGVTGFSYPLDHPEELTDTIEQLLMMSPESYAEMCHNCKTESDKYSAEVVFSEMMSYIRVVNGLQ